MNTTFRVLIAVALGVAMQGTPIGLAWAQGVPPPSASGGTPPSGNAEPAQADDQADMTQAPDLPVLYVTGVEVLRTSTEPTLDIVRVTGLASSDGWSGPQLVPTYTGKPFDDILDLELIATSPDQSQPATGFVPVEAILPLEPGHSIKGVRVRGSENAVTLKQIPGSAQASINVIDCKDCMGKKLVTSGQAQPGQQSVVRQDELPKALRLIQAPNGIRGAEQDPNRLSLILDENSVIVEAFWE